MAKVVVIGAGMGGLAAAIRLRAAGHEVDVLEAGQHAGGKLGVVRLGGYRFDAGPSLFTQPDFHADLFAIAGKRVQDYFEVRKLPTVCNYFWQDGTGFRAPSDPDGLARVLKKELGEDESAVSAYLARGRAKYALAGTIFLNRSLQKLRSFLDIQVLKAVTRIRSLQMFESLNSLNQKTFRTSKATQLFNRYATYNGSDPYKTSAIYSMIPSFEHGEGAYFPVQGMASIAGSLYRLASDIGIQFHFGCKVDALLQEGKRVTGVHVGEKVWRADAVVSNVDVNRLYRGILPPEVAPKRSLEQALSTSAVVFYWGIRRTFAETGLHNILFSDDYKREFEDLFEREIWPEEPTIYLNISSKQKPDDAPLGGENWFVMVNVPAKPELATPWALLSLKEKVLKRLSHQFGVEIGPLIEAEDIMTPAHLQSRNGAWQGALYGSNSNSLFSGFWRHPNFSSKVPGLFFTGGTVHPGGGIPLALKSGQIAAELAGRYLRKVKRQKS